MLRNLLFSLCIVLSTGLTVFSQSGTLKGTIKDQITEEPIPFANIVVEIGGTQVGGGTSDFDGNYIIKPIQPGTYDVRATYIGYKTQIIQGIIISSDRITFYDIDMAPNIEQLDEVEIVRYKVPLISKDQTQSGATVTAEEIEKMPSRSANAVAATVGGVFSRDGERGNVRGARSSGTVMYIDGIRVTGSSALPQSSIEQVSVILGGLPAQYGDATGGVINVTTRGPSRQFGAGIELETSEFLDPYGHNRAGINLNGPIFTKKNERGEVISSLLGYFIAGDFQYNSDGRPFAGDIYKVKDDVLEHLENEPLRPSGLPSGGTFMNAEYLRTDDLEQINSTENTSRYTANVSAKFDIKTTETITLTFGGQYNYFNGRLYNYRASLMNYGKNAHQESTTWRVFGRFTQRFPTDKESNSLVKNVYYSLQVDYSNVHTVTQDADHKDDYFKYGNIGKFNVYKTPTYQLGVDTINGHVYEDFEILNSWDYDTLTTFEPSEFNPLIAQWTTTYYDLYEGRPEGNYQNFDQIQLGGGLINGQGPDAVYGLYQNPGTIQSAYNIGDNSQLAINGAFAADIGNHEIKFGLQFEQRTNRFYFVNGGGLWSLMRSDRGYTNAHIRELDVNNPFRSWIWDGTEQVYTDTIKYYRRYDEESQYWFDKNLREKLGLPVNGLDYIIPSSYDFNNRSITYYDKDGVMHTIFVDEDLFTIDLFSPDELMNDGNYRVLYQGYDYTGEKTNDKPSYNDFFNETNEEGMHTRPIAPYEPIYMAGYIQDKFAFKDLIFNVGVRVDRFDANQPVLRDPYLLYPSRTIGELTLEELEQFGITTTPGNLGDDYIVYVDNVLNPTSIVGYRDGNKWYNSDGFEIQDVTSLAGSTGISPLLVDPNQSRVTAESFKDYEPQWNVMPRISFSFPISDVALFFAHYDVLTQRPTTGVVGRPDIYWFFESLGGTLPNPDLKPQKTIDYELGFQQKVSETSSLTITTYYREMRDMIQLYRFNGAYPKDYTSYNNLDFGTVKGLTFTYDLRRTKNARVRASYTLQFANATAPSATSTAALVAAGLPNLRSTNPVPWDRRHQLNLLIDYRYGEGKDYTGPRITRKIKGTDRVKTVNLLQNFGFSVTFNGGSGTPYNASRNINSPITGGSNLLKGTYYGSRLPWQFRMDARIDKDFKINWGKKEGARASYLNVYFQVLNVLNTKNVINVYPFTGNPDDDGYLAAAEWQQEIDNQLDPQSFRDLYSVFVDNPGNYSAPRRIRVGVIFNF